MIARERTIQQLDPLGVLGSWPLTVAVSIGAAALSVALTAIDLPGLEVPVLAGLGALLIVLAFAFTVWAARPSGAPFRRWAHAVAIVVLLAGVVVAFGSEADPDRAVFVWLPYVLAVFHCIVAAYRPASDVVVSGVVSSAVIGSLAAGSRTALEPGDVFAATGLAAAGPVLAVALGAAAFTGEYVRAVLEWRSRAAAEAKVFADEQRDAIATAVHEGVLDVLNREMLPFFTRLLEKDAIDAHDSDNARTVAETMRAAIVADVDQNWLDALIRRESDGAGVPLGADRSFVDDPDRVADEIDGDGRAALGALVSLVLRWQGRGVDPGLLVSLRAEGASRSGVVEFTDSAGTRRERALLRPYLSILQSTFRSVRLDKRPGRVAIRFSYGHPKGR